MSEVQGTNTQRSPVILAQHELRWFVTSSTFAERMDVSSNFVCCVVESASGG